MIDMLCRILHLIVTICTFAILGLLAIPMVLSLFLMAVVWHGGDLILTCLEKNDHSRVTT